MESDLLQEIKFLIAKVSDEAGFVTFDDEETKAVCRIDGFRGISFDEESDSVLIKFEYNFKRAIDQSTWDPLSILRVNALAFDYRGQRTWVRTAKTADVANAFIDCFVARLEKKKSFSITDVIADVKKSSEPLKAAALEKAERILIDTNEREERIRAENAKKRAEWEAEQQRKREMWLDKRIEDAFIKQPLQGKLVDAGISKPRDLMGFSKNQLLELGLDKKERQRVVAAFYEREIRLRD